MALFTRRVLEVAEATLFVAPIADQQRQFTLLRLTVRALDDEGVNIFVVPVPCSALRKPVVLKARDYAAVFDDLHFAGGQEPPLLDELPWTVAFHASSNRLRVANSLAELRHLRMDGLALTLPQAMHATLEERYAVGFAFIVVVFRPSRKATRLLLAYTHPLMRDALFVPLYGISPRGIPPGERHSIAVDDSPLWPERKVL
jgi:hypothetical protein